MIQHIRRRGIYLPVHRLFVSQARRHPFDLACYRLGETPCPSPRSPGNLTASPSKGQG